MKKIRSLVLHFLRIITPEDLQSIVEELHHHQSIAVGENPAPPVSKSTPKLFLVDDETSPPQQDEKSLEAVGILSADKIRELKERELELQRQSTPTEQEVILSHREKWKDNEEKLHKVEGLKSYQSNANSKLLSFSFKEEGEEGAKKSSTYQGILVDRKQA